MYFTVKLEGSKRSHQWCYSLDPEKHGKYIDDALTIILGNIMPSNKQSNLSTGVRTSWNTKTISKAGKKKYMMKQNQIKRKQYCSWKKKSMHNYRIITLMISEMNENLLVVESDKSC